MVDVIIPRCNKESLSNTLLSLGMQCNKENINVYLIGTYDSEIEKFKSFFNINFIESNEKKLGVLYQIGFNSSNSDYVYFLRPGDVLYDFFALESLSREMGNGYDMVIGKNVVKNDLDFIDVSYSGIYGKLFRRSFILKNKVLFDDCEMYSDWSFYLICDLISNNKDFFDSKVCVLKDDKFLLESVSLKNIDLYNKAVMFFYEEALKRNLDKSNIIYSLFDALLNIYKIYNVNIDNKNVNDVLVKSMDLYNAFCDLEKEVDFDKNILYKYNSSLIDINYISFSEFRDRYERLK